MESPPHRARAEGRATWLAALAAAAIAVAIFLVLGRDEPAPSTAGPQPQPGVERSATTLGAEVATNEEIVRSATASEAQAADVRAMPAPGASLLLAGIVVDTDERPIAGAEVVAEEQLGAGFMLLAEGRDAVELGRRTTGTDGRFAMPVPFARVVTLRARAEGFARCSLQPCYGGEEHRIVLQQGARLVVRVTDAESGAPVPDVELTGRVSGTTGGDGACRFDELAPGVVVIDLTPPEHEAQLRREVELKAGETAMLDVALARGGTVFGTVTDAATGQAIAGAEIGAGWTFEKRVRTDAAGNYTMRGAPGPGVPDMHARAPGYAAASVPVRGSGEQRVDFALQRGGAVRGRIVDRAGMPLGGVYVAADADLGVRNGMGLTDWQHTRSGSDGMFRIVGLVPGAEYALLARQRGRATTVLLLPDAIAADRELDAGDLVLGDPAVLLGRVVDRDGSGVPGARVSLRGANDDHDRLLPVDEREHRRVPTHAASRDAETDGEGRFRFGDLAGGSYTVHVSIRSGPRSMRDGVQVAAGRTTQGVEIELDLGRSIAGSVATADGAALPPHVSVRVRGSEGPDHWAGVEPSGRFRVLGLNAGEYRVEAFVTQWANDEQAPWIGSTVDAVAAGTGDLRLVLQPAAFIAGRVVDADGQACPRIVVVAVDANGAEEPARAQTQDDGSFRLRVRPGSVCDLRYGPAPELPVLLDPHPETAKEHPGVRAGTAGVVLQWTAAKDR